MKRQKPPRYIDQRAVRLHHIGNALMGVEAVVILFGTAALAGNHFKPAGLHYGLAGFVIVLAAAAFLCKLLAVPVDRQGRLARQEAQRNYDLAVAAAEHRAALVPVAAPPDEPEWVEPPAAKPAGPTQLRAELMTVDDLARAYTG